MRILSIILVALGSLYFADAAVAKTSNVCKFSGGRLDGQTHEVPRSGDIGSPCTDGGANRGIFVEESGGAEIESGLDADTAGRESYCLISATGDQVAWRGQGQNGGRCVVGGKAGKIISGDR